MVLYACHRCHHLQMYVTVKLITSKTLKPRSKATKMMAGISRPELTGVCAAVDRMRLAWMGDWASCCTLQVNTRSVLCADMFTRYELSRL